MNGKVKAVTENQYLAIGKGSELLKGRLIATMYNKYDERGNVIEHGLHNMKDAESIDKNKITKPEDFKSGEKYKYKYDKSGNKIQMKSYFKSGKFEEKWVYNYNENGKKLSMKHYLPKDKRYNSKYNYTYDNKGNMIEKIVYNKKDKLIEKNTFEYDNNGNVIGSDSYDDKGVLTERDVYKYNDKGKMIECSNYYTESKFYRNFSYIYDEGGKVTERKECTTPGNNPCSKSNYQYLNYDNEGNCIRLVKFQNDENEYVAEREIEYYK